MIEMGFKDKEEVLKKLRYSLHRKTLEVQSGLALWLSSGYKSYFDDAYKDRERWQGMYILGIEMGFKDNELVDGATALPSLSKAKRLFNEKVKNGEL